jgi:hypothetical protein
MKETKVADLAHLVGDPWAVGGDVVVVDGRPRPVERGGALRHQALSLGATAPQAARRALQAGALFRSRTWK